MAERKIDEVNCNFSANVICEKIEIKRNFFGSFSVVI